jgi:hypothetical protein
MGSPFRGGSILGRYYPGLGLLGFNMSRALQIMQMRRILIGLPPRFAGMGGPGMMGPGLMGPAMMGPAMIPRGMVPPGLIQPGMPGSGGAAAPGGAGGAGGAGGKEGDKDKAPKPEASKKKTPKSDKSKSEAPKPEKSKSDKPKPEAPKQENPKSEKPKSMGPRIGKNEAVKRFQERVSGMFGGTKDGKLRWATTKENSRRQLRRDTFDGNIECVLGVDKGIFGFRWASYDEIQKYIYIDKSPLEPWSRTWTGYKGQWNIILYNIGWDNSTWLEKASNFQFLRVSVNIIPPLLDSRINNALSLDSRGLICLLLLREAAGMMFNMVLFVELLGLDVLPEHVSLEEVRKLSQSICCMVSCSAEVVRSFVLKGRKLGNYLTPKTWSSSSRVLPLVSGTKKRTPKNPMMFQTAYQANAPWGLNAFSRLGHVTLRTKLKNHVVAVASDIPRGRMYSGYASAE